MIQILLAARSVPRWARPGLPYGRISTLGSDCEGLFNLIGRTEFGCGEILRVLYERVANYIFGPILSRLTNDWLRPYTLSTRRSRSGPYKSYHVFTHCPKIPLGVGVFYTPL